MTQYIRIALYATLVAFMIYSFQIWDKEHSSVSASNNAAVTETSSAANNFVPNNIAASNNAPAMGAAPATAVTALIAKNLVHVTTDLIQADIDPVGGNIVQVKLLKYPSITLRNPVCIIK